MQKVFLLLRNNRQSGPFTLDELAAQELQDKDLVWEEGRSFGWSYPSEIPQLRPYIRIKNAAAMPQRGNKSGISRVFVSLPGAAQGQKNHGPQPEQQKAQDSLSIEERADRVRMNALQTGGSLPEMETRYSRSLEDAGYAYGDWLINRKKKKTRRPYWVLAAILVFTVAGWYFFRGENENQTLPQQIVELPKHEEPKPIEEMHSPVENKRLELAGDGGTGNSSSNTPPANTVKTENRKAGYMNSGKEENTSETDPGPAREDQKDLVNAGSGREKKSLGTTLGGFFRSLGVKKENGPPSGRNEKERYSVNRGDEAAVPADLSRIQLKPSERKNEWMLGIQGMKLTLVNRNSSAISSATVEVLYFSDDDEAIESRKLLFRDIASGKTSTMPVPDHRFASRVDFRLVEALSREE